MPKRITRQPPGISATISATSPFQPARHRMLLDHEDAAELPPDAFHLRLD